MKESLQRVNQIGRKNLGTLSRIWAYTACYTKLRRQGLVTKNGGGGEVGCGCTLSERDYGYGKVNLKKKVSIKMASREYYSFLTRRQATQFWKNKNHLDFPNVLLSLL